MSYIKNIAHEKVLKLTDEISGQQDTCAKQFCKRDTVRVFERRRNQRSRFCR